MPRTQEEINKKISSIYANKNPLYCGTAQTFIRRFLLRPHNYVRATHQCPVGCAETFTDPNECQEKLKMRRKVHILQHQSHIAHQTQSLTKKMKYSMMVKGNNRNLKTYGSQNKTVTNPNIIAPQYGASQNIPLYLRYNKINQMSAIIDPTRCTGELVPTTASQSGVPGDPGLILQLDPNVPLTMIHPPVDHFPSGNVPAQPVYQLNNVISGGGGTTKIAVNTNQPYHPMPEAPTIIPIQINEPQTLKCLSLPGCDTTGLPGPCAGPCTNPLPLPPDECH